MMKKGIIEVLLLGAIAASGCIHHKKQAHQPAKASGVTRQVPAPRDAATVLPLLRKFTPELGMEYIETVLGEPAGDIGSNFHLYIYHLNDRTTVSVQAQMSHDHESASGKYKPVAVISIAHGTQTIYDSRK